MFLTSSFLPIPSHDGHPTTTASADFSQFVVTTANETVRETSRDKPASLSSSTCLIYIHGLRLPFGLCCPKPAHPPCTPCIRFLSVKLRFRYPFFSPIPHDINLGSRLGVRRQLRPLWTFTTDERHARHTAKARSISPRAFRFIRSRNPRCRRPRRWCR